MPPLVSVSIPVNDLSPPSARSSFDKVKAPLKLEIQRRTYNGDPLPVKPSENAPRKARIVGREIAHNGAFYTLKIGDVEINDVGIDEILDYVSAQHLEEYENKQFEEEEELLRIAEVEKERLAEERQQRKKEKALRKGIVIFQEIDSADDGNVDSTSGAEIGVGRSGRARPTYKHLFKLPQERRRRKRDPITGELVPLSNDDEQVSARESSENEARESAGSGDGHAALSQQPKRRRRKRDPKTGELLPLEPLTYPIKVQSSIPSDGLDVKKRPRRRRHPLTGELMPLGWRYDPSAPSQQQGRGSKGGVNAVSPAMGRLSITQENAAKRVKLGHQSSSATPSSTPLVGPALGESVSTSEESVGEGEEDLGSSGPPSKPYPVVTKGQLGVSQMLQPAATANTFESSPRRNTMTSIMQPTAAEPVEDLMSEEDDLDDDEWVIEAILAHRLSDPKTHRPELGKKPVMLYQVKWEGSDELTWEPVESFPDRSVIEDYRRHLRDTASRSKDKKASPWKDTVPVAPNPQPPAHRSPPAPITRETASQEDEEEEEEDDEGTYVVEGILSHRMSDPRTHGPDFGKVPIMLYEVKWKGYSNSTWEPLDSFEDRKVVHRYRRTVGLPDIEDEDEDEHTD